MRKVIWMGFGVIVFLGVGTLWIAGCKGSKENSAKTEAQKKDDYTCSMHPAVSSDKPGACPVCGMVLEKRSGLFAGSAAAAEEKFQLTLPADKQVLANVATAKAEHRRLERSILTVGTVAESEQRLFHVPSRVPGRIEKLFVDYTGAFVNKGDPLFVIYSPELVTAQKEYLLHLPKTGLVPHSMDSSFRVASREKLLLWGITPEQLAILQSGDTIYTRLTIYSPRSGIVVARNKLAGSYVAEGDIVYDIADLSAVWVWADIYEYEIAGVAIGTPVRVSSPAYPGKKFSGRISFVSPEVNKESRTIRVRAELENPGLLLKPGMYVDVDIKIQTGKAVLAIPTSAVLQTGNRQVVWVKAGATTFEPRAVALGVRGGDWWEVLSGLHEGEEVVSSGGYLLDSEAQFRLGKPATGHEGHKM
ncbi:MAG: efflux RND transporter periplasmic adaptor subunit [candidate division Zixibacteria bacterium]|nr:efflux RND transporter periplasmic adaptor subunit [candidate division Zixibacteria bacterium]MCI0596782.1 efflux RND transporter periplasmic adaptor subunit [candidate division Zixibacteria bacterium]